MASNTVDVVTRKRRSQEKDTAANVELHKERYLHLIENKYRNGTMNGSTAMFRAKGKKIVDVIEGRVEGIENVSKLRYAIKKRNFKVFKNNYKI